MNKYLRSASDIRVSSLVCSSIAILLSACGGAENANPAKPAAAVQAPQFASLTYNGTLAPNDLYVSPTGADTNPGTQAAPFKTIERAARAATPGVTVRVMPGTYAGGFQTSASGTTESPIRYVSVSKRGAKIVPPVNSTTTSAWDNRGSYVEIDGFEVNGTNVQSGTKWLNGIYTAGSYSTIRNNYVHHIAKTVACTGSGGGIGSDSYYKGVANNVIANVVHDVGPTSCAYFLGIFINTASSRVDNNLVYAISNAGIRLWHDATNAIVATSSSRSRSRSAVRSATRVSYSGGVRTSQ